MSASLAPECSEVKEKYDACFIRWYSEKFLRGNSTEDECAELFKEYKTCLYKTLKEKGILDMIEESKRNSQEAVRKS